VETNAVDVNPEPRDAAEALEQTGEGPAVTDLYNEEDQVPEPMCMVAVNVTASSMRPGDCRPISVYFPGNSPDLSPAQAHQLMCDLRDAYDLVVHHQSMKGPQR
jgi:hypothetical protein